MKKIKNAKIIEIWWAGYKEGFNVRYASKRKHNFKGCNGPDWKIADYDMLFIERPIGTPFAEVRKLAYEILNKM